MCASPTPAESRPYRMQNRSLYMPLARDNPCMKRWKKKGKGKCKNRGVLLFECPEIIQVCVLVENFSTSHLAEAFNAQERHLDIAERGDTLVATSLDKVVALRHHQTPFGKCPS